MRRFAAGTVASLLIASNAFAQPEDDPSPVAPVPGAAAGTDTAGTAEQPSTASPEVQPQVGMGTQKEEAPPPAEPDRAMDPAAAAEPDEIDEEKEADYGHGGQFGLRAGIVAGYRMVFRYDDSPYCKEPDPMKEAKDQQKFCGHQGPWAVDLGLSFAPLDGLEPYVWARFGLEGESQTNTNPVRILGAGLRVYTMSDSQFKIFVSPALAYEFEDGAGNAAWVDQQGNPFEYKQDVIFHLSAGPQFDFAPGFGAYFSAGMTVGILRYIHANLEGQLGVQIRIP